MPTIKRDEGPIDLWDRFLILVTRRAEEFRHAAAVHEFSEVDVPRKCTSSRDHDREDTLNIEIRKVRWAICQRLATRCRRRPGRIPACLSDDQEMKAAGRAQSQKGES
jgi:hypothetical protein